MRGEIEPLYKLIVGLILLPKGCFVYQGGVLLRGGLYLALSGGGERKRENSHQSAARSTSQCVSRNPEPVPLRAALLESNVSEQLFVLFC